MMNWTQNQKKKNQDTNDKKNAENVEILFY
jgi:hypothetical protein